jgi:hypothetical protein
MARIAANAMVKSENPQRHNVGFFDRRAQDEQTARCAA